MLTSIYMAAVVMSMMVVIIMILFVSVMFMTKIARYISATTGLMFENASQL